MASGFLPRPAPESLQHGEAVLAESAFLAGLCRAPPPCPRAPFRRRRPQFTPMYSFTGAQPGLRAADGAALRATVPAAVQEDGPYLVFRAPALVLEGAQEHHVPEGERLCPASGAAGLKEAVERVYEEGLRRRGAPSRRTPGYRCSALTHLVFHAEAAVLVRVIRPHRHIVGVLRKADGRNVRAAPCP